MTDPAEIPVPREVAPFVEALGVERAIALFLAFGGTALYISEKPTAKSRAVAVVGEDGVRSLHAIVSQRVTGTQNVRIPLAKPWIARTWRARQKLSVSEIARRLHVNDTTVRRWIPIEDRGPSPQLSLF